MITRAIMPILMVKNEEYVIRAVLDAALEAFGWALVGDTGSRDATVEIVRALPGVRLVTFGALDPRALGQARGVLARLAQEMGAAWGFQIDGDELYDPARLAEIARYAPPEGKRCGFTRMVTIDDDGQVFWELDDVFSRLALFPLTDDWIGEYPFEAPASWCDETNYFYYPIADDAIHAVHLHRLQRSPRLRPLPGIAQ